MRYMYKAIIYKTGTKLIIIIFSLHFHQTRSQTNYMGRGGGVGELTKKNHLPEEGVHREEPYMVQGFSTLYLNLHSISLFWGGRVPPHPSPPRDNLLKLENKTQRDLTLIFM